MNNTIQLVMCPQERWYWHSVAMRMHSQNCGVTLWLCFQWQPTLRLEILEWYETVVSVTTSRSPWLSEVTSHQLPPICQRALKYSRGILPSASYETSLVHIGISYEISGEKANWKSKVVSKILSVWCLTKQTNKTMLHRNKQKQVKIFYLLNMLKHMNFSLLWSLPKTFWMIKLLSKSYNCWEE